MTTSGPSQAPLFEDGSETPEKPHIMFPTPTANEGGDGDAGLALRNRPSHRGRKLAGSGIFTSSPAAIPASHSHSPGSAWARRMTAISGRQLRRWWPTSSLGGVFSRMCTDTSVWGSTRCYLTWKRSATHAGRSLFLLRPSAPPTGGIGSGFWPTPVANDDNKSPEAHMAMKQRMQGGPRNTITSLNVMVKAIDRGMWPTPTSSESTGAGHTGEGGLNLRTAVDREMWPTPRHEGFDAGSHRGKPDSLHAAVKLMPTPTARDWKDGSSVQNVPENGLLGRWAVNHSTTPEKGRKLSAAWVCRMMGYPDFWLDLED